MQLGGVHRQSRLLIPRVWRASGPWERMRGLLGRKPLARGEAMLIEPCSSIHTVGMTYSLDAVFVDASGKVVKLFERVKPLRAAFGFGALGVIELMGGEIRHLGIVPGDELKWIENHAD